MNDMIIKEYRAFQAGGFKEWKDNIPMIQVISNDGSNWTHLELTVEEATRAVAILQNAIEEAKNAEDHLPWNLDETPF
jgi:hypothetical protein